MTRNRTTLGQPVASRCGLWLCLLLSVVSRSSGQVNVTGDEPTLAEAMVLYQSAESDRERAEGAYWLGVRFADPAVHAGRFDLSIRYLAESASLDFRPALFKLFDVFEGLNDRQQRQATPLIGRLAGEGNRVLLDALLEAGDHENPAMRRGAVFFLRFAKPSENDDVMTALQKALADEDESVRVAASMKLPGAEQIARDEDAPLPARSQPPDEWVIAAREGDVALIEKMEPIFNQAKTDDTALHELKLLAQHKNPAVRHQAMKAAGKLFASGREEAVDILYPHFESQNWQDIRTAFEALVPAALAREDPFHLLLRGAENTNGFISSAAMSGLEKCLQQMAESLLTKDNNETLSRLRLVIVETRANTGRAAVRAVAKAANEGHDGARELLFEAARRQDGPVSGQALELLDKLALKGDREARKLMVDATEQGDTASRAGAMKGLGRLAAGDREAYQILESKTRESNGDYVQAAEALGLTCAEGNLQALAHLRRMFELPEFDGQGHAAASGLGVALAHGASDAEEVLVNGLQSTSEQTRRIAGYGLEKAVALGSAKAAGSLIRLAASGAKEARTHVVASAAHDHSKTLNALREVRSTLSEKEQDLLVSVLVELVHLRIRAGVVLLEIASDKESPVAEKAKEALQKLREARQQNRR